MVSAPVAQAPAPLPYYPPAAPKLMPRPPDYKPEQSSAAPVYREKMPTAAPLEEEAEPYYPDAEPTPAPAGTSLGKRISGIGDKVDARDALLDRLAALLEKSNGK